MKRLAFLNQYLKHNIMLCATLSQVRRGGAHLKMLIPARFLTSQEPVIQWLTFVPVYHICFSFLVLYIHMVHTHKFII